MDPDLPCRRAPSQKLQAAALSAVALVLVVLVVGAILHWLRIAA